METEAPKYFDEIQPPKTGYGYSRGKWKVKEGGVQFTPTTKVTDNMGYSNITVDENSTVEKGVLNLDPGTLIYEIIDPKNRDSERNFDPVPGTNEKQSVQVLTTDGQYTFSKLYHVEIEKVDDKSKGIAKLVAGQNKSDLKSVEDKKTADFNRGVRDVKLSGGDTIADFENYYVTNKLVEKIASGEDKDSYKVISPNNKNGHALSYGGKTYKNGNILRFS
jgi:hypothetical protein